MLQDINVDGALCDNVVDMDGLIMPVAATSSDCLGHGRVVFVLHFREERCEEDDVICVDQVSVRG